MNRQPSFQLINKLINWNDTKLFIVFFLIWIIFSYPFFWQGKIPAPLDFLVNFYSPWEQYFDFPVKNPAISDVVSQIIPWKIFNAQELKAGRIPLWNPYNLAGTPHLGNWQSGALYPTTLLFLIFSDQVAWSLHILLQPLLAGIFMILFLRQLRITDGASLFGGIVFAYGGFMTTWLEWGTLGHALLWLPLALYGVVRQSRIPLRGKRLNFLTIFALTMSLLAGHPQTSIYIMITVIGYYLYKNIRNGSIPSLLPASCFLFLLPFLLAAPQVLPSIQVYSESARSLIDGRSWAEAFLIKPINLTTFLAPDFFGNPVTRNSWSNFSYVEMSGYIGVIALFLVLVEVYETSTPKKFFALLILAAIILAVDNPISRLLINLKIPIISDSSPARIMGLIDFSLAVLAAFGLNRLIKYLKAGKFHLIFPAAAILGLIFAGMWLWTFVSTNPNVLVARRNLIFPSAILMVFSTAFGGSMILKKMNIVNNKGLSLLLVSCFLFLVSIDLFRFHYKFTPFVESKYWYPEVPTIRELKNKPGRVFGIFEGNLNLPFRIKSVEGYDPLINREIVELTFSQAEISRENRIVSPSFPRGKPETIELLNNLGVKWVVDYAVAGNAPWDFRLWNYGDQFNFDWKDSNYKIFYNTYSKNEEQEPIGRMKNDQLKLFKMGALVSGVSLFGILTWRSKYGK